MVKRFVLKSGENTVHGYLEDLNDFIKMLPVLPLRILEYHIREGRNDFQEWLNKEFNLDLEAPQAELSEVINFLCSKAEQHFININRLKIIEELPKVDEKRTSLEVLSIFPPPELEVKLFGEDFF
jgi:hypothetical protein